MTIAYIFAKTKIKFEFFFFKNFIFYSTVAAGTIEASIVYLLENEISDHLPFSLYLFYAEQNTVTINYVNDMLVCCYFLNCLVYPSHSIRK